MGDDRYTCPTCGLSHLGPCHLRSGRCFQCGKLGHKKKDYPQWQQFRTTLSSAQPVLQASVVVSLGRAPFTSVGRGGVGRGSGGRG